MAEEKVDSLFFRLSEASLRLAFVTQQSKHTDYSIKDENVKVPNCIYIIFFEIIPEFSTQKQAC
ncbi:hypothetical protein NP92_12435 [Anoxybacillus gonensis]|nr:hypothetical protein NP92_12435 [Anoxybacillus gonensis]